MSLHSPYQIVNLALLIVACGAALWRGGPSERIAAGAMALAWLISPFVQINIQAAGPQIGVLAVDAALLALLLAIALTSHRWWPMWASAFHAVGTLMHLLVAIDVQIEPRSYFIGTGLLSYLTMGALLIGSLTRRGATARPPS